jgi:uncharacterized membrane protein
MFSFQNIPVFLTILFSGLVAGLLYSYSCSVNIGLKALPNEEYLKAMQSINIAIQNPYFFISFMGLLLLFPLTGWIFYSQKPTISFYLLLIAAALYFIGVFGVTVFGNVPLNDQLAKFGISSASPNQISTMRLTFESEWNKFHLIRTVSAILSFGLTILTIMKYKQ